MNSFPRTWSEPPGVIDQCVRRKAFYLGCGLYYFVCIIQWEASFVKVLRSSIYVYFSLPFLLSQPFIYLVLLTWEIIAFLIQNLLQFLPLLLRLANIFRLQLSKR